MKAESPLDRLPTHRRVLANGLTALVRVDRSTPAVAIVTHVKAGYFDEDDSVVGVSHVLEHMFFKGTDRRGVGQIAEETKRAGGYLNASTIYDQTLYYTVLPSSSLETGLDIQSDALRNSRIDEEELRRELLVIIQEAKRKLDNPSAVATESLYALMFEQHRMRRWRIGSDSGLAAMTRADVAGFYRTMYQPGNIVLAVAGDVDAERTFALIEKYYGDIPRGVEPAERGAREPAQTRPRFRRITGDIVQSHLEIGWHTVEPLHDDYAVLDVLAIVLGQGRAARLYRDVRERGLVSGISAYNYAPTEVGVFVVGAEIVPGDVERAFAEIERSLQRVRQEGVRADEVERAQNILEARLLKQTETMEGQARLITEWEALGDWQLASAYLERVRAVTASDVQRAAAKYLSPESVSILLYEPRDVQDRVLQMQQTVQHKRVAPRRHSEDEVLFYDRGDGTRLVVLPRRSVPLVSMSIAFPGGVVEEDIAQAGRTALVGRVSIKGTRQRTAAQLAEEIESYGGSISPSVSSDLASWNLSLPSRHFERGLELLCETALQPSFPDSETEREIKLTLADLEQARDDMYQYPLRLMLQAAYPDHPYGFGLEPVESAVRDSSAALLREWHERVIARRRAHVFIVGDVDPDDAARLVERACAHEHALEEASHVRAAHWPGEAASRAELRDKAQTALALAFPGPRRGEDDVYALQLLSNVVSGLGGRFFEELRSRRSLAYTVSTFPLARAHGGAFVAYIATSPERESEARAGLLEEFDRLTNEPVTAAELERAQRYMIGTWHIRRQTNGAQLSDLAGALLFGAGLKEIREFEERISALTAQDLRTVAQKYFDQKRVVEGIVRGAQRTM